MTQLRIAPGLAIDADYVGGGTFALLAKKGAGKTYTGRVTAEEMWNAKIPFVVLDPMGAWWTLAKVKHTGGTFGDYLSALRTAGAIEESGSGRSAEYRITEHGFELLGTEAPAPASTEELLAMWRDRLKRGARIMLDQLVDRYPDWLSREDLAVAAGIEVTGGTFGDYLSTLRRTGLVEEDSANSSTCSCTCARCSGPRAKTCCSHRSQAKDDPHPPPPERR